MSFEAWTVFSVFWVVFVTTPGPNAVNCISNGMQFGFVRALPGVAAILVQASLFLSLSALGVAALLVASPTAFMVAKLGGAGFLIWLGLRTWRSAGQRVETPTTPGSIFGRAFLIATLNAKSVAGYLAAFSTFVQADVPIAAQMWVIFPTALTITALSYCSFTALGAGLGRSAHGVVLNIWFRRMMGAAFVIYGFILGNSAIPGRTA